VPELGDMAIQQGSQLNHTYLCPYHKSPFVIFYLIHMIPALSGRNIKEKAFVRKKVALALEELQPRKPATH